MSAHVFSLVTAALLGIQPVSVPLSVSKASPGIWAPPKTAPAPAPALPTTGPSAENVGRLLVHIRDEIRNRRRNGELSAAQAKAFWRDVDAIGYLENSFAMGGLSDLELTELEDRLDALDSMMYAKSSDPGQ